MSEITVAIRYAKALIDLAQEQNSLEAVKNDMELFLRTVKASSELGAVLANPIISHSKKVHILADVFGASVSKVTLAFLNIMVNKGRGEVLFTTAQEFIGLYDIKNHITNARVVTASPLSAENKKKMLDDVQQAIGGTVKLKDKVDPSLIGGFVLTVGDRQVDTSIASSLKRMKKEFAQVAIK
ncbi:ATP synthase F1 subunit delta [Mucilaginibacter sp. AK015]|uniref:ATP synthase F1 subunit delta n=1 Tax=Mucilaginibacter sp. AK015 TaxID=2723072 RepID=UPI00161EF1E0|nr:ATP synthase F1 subunit delta [Mucilaginibacter sp. AK015]MBB5397898.1 F-type H+-transporting ATPase subunit delta [Mucilaginibacter sp. AK015]